LRLLLERLLLLLLLLLVEYNIAREHGRRVKQKLQQTINSFPRATKKKKGGKKKEALESLVPLVGWL